MVSTSSISTNSLLETMSLQRELAQGEISIKDNNSDFDTSMGSFSSMIKHKISAVNEDQNVAVNAMKAVDSGQSDDLVGAMVASQKASLSFSAMIQIRNRLMQAFDEVMKMPL